MKNNDTIKCTAGIVRIDKNLLFAKKKFEHKFTNGKNYCKVKDHRYYTGKYRGAVHSIRNLKIGIPKWISLVFHNGSNYDYHVIIKKLAKEFEKRI